MTSHLCRRVILTTLLGCTGRAAGSAEPSATPVKDKIALDRWTYIHAGDSREPAADGRAGDFRVGFGDVNGDGYLDIVTKPYTWDTPRVDVWMNQGVAKQ
jgi:hypothetical protein